MAAAQRAVLVFVLNARRHRRGNQQSSENPGDAIDRCSTPEGIGGGIRDGIKAGELRSEGAQRPKASEGESETQPSADGNYVECSTPEGIGGGISC